eukprot:scaffold154518_cov37-Tisochrysis_lutea.AAC.2
MDLAHYKGHSDLRLGVEPAKSAESDASSSRGACGAETVTRLPYQSKSSSPASNKGRACLPGALSKQ